MKTLIKILEDEYGVTIENAPALTLLWAADRIHDVPTAKKELKKANIKRIQLGKMPTHIPYGHRLF